MKDLVMKYEGKSGIVPDTIVSFNSEPDRVKGIGALFRSEYQYEGLEKNKFRICQAQKQLLDSKNIKYSIH
jgi:hypothetical protein